MTMLSRVGKNFTSTNRSTSLKNLKISIQMSIGVK